MKKMIPALAILLSACATSSVYLDIMGAKWRKTEAFSATIFAVGRIDTEGRNRFYSQGRVTLENFLIEALTTFHSQETATASLEAEGKWSPNIADISGDLKAKKEQRLKNKFVVFRNRNAYDLIDKLNDSKNTSTLARLKGERYPVIITGVAIGYDNESFNKIEFSAGAKVTLKPGSKAPVVSLKGSSGTEINTFYSDGTVFAYEYSRIEWDSTSNTPKVKNLTVDRPANPWF